jgi:hypothetical protein
VNNEKIFEMTCNLIDTLHASRISNAEVISVIALMLANEMRLAKRDCGESGGGIVVQKFLRDLTRAFPEIGFNVTFFPTGAKA